ncbi:MAG: TIGR02221 family CRISPR-associated protein [Clostridiales Family XIII bacterium]|nr:TIGR02221 family CRISPR-associated protein [Clostridiales Family XIII bacterium]
MANILISSFGNGSRDPNTTEWGYRDTIYFDVATNRQTKTPKHLIMPAMQELFKIDKVLLIGTVGSDWSMLYKEVMAGRSGFKPVSKQRDGAYYRRLKEYYDRSKSERISVKEMKDALKILKTEMGEAYSDFCVLEYGITQEEQMYNMNELMKSVDACVRDGDAVFFDISHSFRSLPFYALLVSRILKQIKNNVTIEMIPYAMFEAKGLFQDRTPLVDMSQLVDMVDLASAVDEYKNFGTAYQLIRLLENDTYFTRELATELGGNTTDALRLLGTSVSANNIADFQNAVKKIVEILNSPQSLINHSDKLIVFKMLFSSIAEDFGAYKDDAVALQFAFSRWHYRHGRFLHSVILLYEAIVSMVAEMLDQKNLKSIRKTTNHTLYTSWSPGDNYVPFDAEASETLKRFFDAYHNIRKIRNSSAHVHTLSQLDMDNYKKYSERMQDIYDETTKNVKLAEELKKEIRRRQHFVDQTNNNTINTVKNLEYLGE